MNTSFRKAFTLVEMLIVIVIIGILAAALIPRLKMAQGKARDVTRQVHIRDIQVALDMYHTDNGYLPTTNTYGGANPGGWDYSSQGGFLMFLRDGGYMRVVPLDPINNMPGDGTVGTYSYRYFCYPNINYYGPCLGYWKETPTRVAIEPMLPAASQAASVYKCN